MLQYMKQAYARVVRKISTWFNRFEKVSFLAGLAGTVLVCGTYVAIVGNKGFPVTEGWWSVFAKYINEGKLPYRDFELLFTPVYTYIIAGITAVFGYDLIVLRIVGLLLFVGIAVMAYLIFSRLFKPYIAMVGACLTALFMQLELCYIFYDYSRFYDFFTLLSCFFLMVYVSSCNQPSKRKFSWSVTLCGLFSSIAMLIRQPHVIVVTYIVVLLVFFTIILDNKKALLVNLANYLVSLLLPVAVLLAIMVSNGSLSNFLRMTTTDAIAAKGGIRVELFAWIGRAVPYVLSKKGTIAVLLAVLLVNNFLYTHCRKCKENKVEDTFWGILFGVLVLLGVLLCYRYVQFSLALDAFRTLQTPYSLYAVVVLVFVYTFLCLLRYNNLDTAQQKFFLLFFTLTGMVIAIGYGSGTSGCLVEGQTALALGTIFATILSLSRYRFGKPMKLIVLALSVCMCLSFVGYKYVHPYWWWGLTEPDIRQATETIDLDYMNGIKVSLKTKTAVEGIANTITKNSKKGDNVFTFPHIPIFYLLTDRYPSTFTLVQWFDASSDYRVKADIQNIEQYPPKVIVIGQVPDFAIAAHESGFRGGKYSGLRLMMEALETFVLENNYRYSDTYTLDTDYQFKVYVAR